MTRAAKPALQVVQTDAEPRKDIYAADKAKAMDLDRWRRLHEQGERREAIFLPDRPRCFLLPRRLFKFEERR